jgi:hypothetical protein
MNCFLMKSMRAMCAPGGGKRGLKRAAIIATAPSPAGAFFSPPA